MDEDKVFVIMVATVASVLPFHLPVGQYNGEMKCIVGGLACWAYRGYVMTVWMGGGEGHRGSVVCGVVDV